MTKQTWQQPVLEVLDVRQTLAGVGWKYIDYVTAHDLDITNDPKSPGGKDNFPTGFPDPTPGTPGIPGIPGDIPTTS